MHTLILRPFLRMRLPSRASIGSISRLLGLLVALHSSTVAAPVPQVPWTIYYSADIRTTPKAVDLPPIAVELYNGLVNGTCSIPTTCYVQRAVGAELGLIEALGVHRGYGQTSVILHILNDACPANCPAAVSYVLKGPLHVQYKNCNSVVDNAMYDIAKDECACPPTLAYSPEVGRCVPSMARYFMPQICPPGGNPEGGNPIFPMTGAKEQTETLGTWLGESFSLRYSTLPNVAKSSINDGAQFLPRPTAMFGPLWQISLARRLDIQRGYGDVVAAVQAQRPGGRWQSFRVNGSYNTYVPSASGSADSISIDRNTGFATYLDTSTNSVEVYDGGGSLQRVVRADGRELVFSYSDTSTPASVAPAAGLLIEIRDVSGRIVRVRYTAASAPDQYLISELVSPAGEQLRFSYDALDNLTSIQRGSTPPRIFHYEDARHPWAMTGVTDEQGIRASTYSYDATGLAVSTERAGGVDRFSVSYVSPPQWELTETFDANAYVLYRDYHWRVPQGASMKTPHSATESQFEFSLVAGLPRLTGRTQPAGAGCGPASNSQRFDAAGNLASLDDFRGNRSCMSNNARGLEVVRVEGIANSVECGTVLPEGAALPVGGRKTSTTWHPQWRLPTSIAEPQRITLNFYNGETDPVTWGRINCAPASAVFPNGKPIPLLCKRVEQATTDVDGSQGFSAALQSGVPNREEKWTYNARGQVLTHDGPRTDVADVTTYTYYTDTSFAGADPDAIGHAIGDLQSVTNAVGQVTQYTRYDKHGNLLQSIDPNGVVSSYVYDARGRLLSVTVGDQVTSYTYDPSGNLTRVTLPDGNWTGYEYDDARRQRAVLDNQGNRIDYTLDDAGNRTAEVVKDPSGALKRQLVRSIDALGRVQQILGRP